MSKKVRRPMRRVQEVNGTVYDPNESLALLDQEISSLAQAQEKLSLELRERIRETVSLVERQWSEFRAELRGLAEQFAASRRTNWPLIIAAIMLVLTMVGGGSVIIRQQTENTVLHSINDLAVSRDAVTSKMRGDLDANTARDEVSENDRRQINAKLIRQEETLGAIRTEQEVFRAKLTEVETQFKASDSSRNTQFAEQQRMNNILLQISQGKK